MWEQPRLEQAQPRRPRRGRWVREQSCGGGCHGPSQCLASAQLSPPGSRRARGLLRVGHPHRLFWPLPLVAEREQSNLPLQDQSCSLDAQRFRCGLSGESLSPETWLGGVLPARNPGDEAWWPITDSKGRRLDVLLPGPPPRLSPKSCPEGAPMTPRGTRRGSGREQNTLSHRQSS